MPQKKRKESLFTQKLGSKPWDASFWDGYKQSFQRQGKGGEGRIGANVATGPSPHVTSSHTAATRVACVGEGGCVCSGHPLPASPAQYKKALVCANWTGGTKSREPQKHKTKQKHGRFETAHVSEFCCCLCFDCHWCADEQVRFGRRWRSRRYFTLLFRDKGARDGALLRVGTAQLLLQVCAALCWPRGGWCWHRCDLNSSRLACEVWIEAQHRARSSITAHSPGMHQYAPAGFCEPLSPAVVRALAGYHVKAGHTRPWPPGMHAHAHAHAHALSLRRALMLHVPQKTANFGKKESAESASRRRFLLARQCELHSARIAAQWVAAPTLSPSSVARGCAVGLRLYRSRAGRGRGRQQPQPLARRAGGAWRRGPSVRGPSVCGPSVHGQGRLRMRRRCGVPCGAAAHA